MNERQKRLNEVYEHLRKFYGIHTQSDFANALRKSRNAITLALNGDEKYLTNKLFKNICEAYPGVFNLNYLLNGEGELLTPEEDVKSSEIEKAAKPSSDDSAAMNNILEMYARMIRGVDDLRVELNTNLAEVKALKEDLHQAVYDFRDATYRLTQALKEISGTTSIRPMDIAAEDRNY
jgi:transcriptional regulator with XRE-family HTH domain